MFIFFGVGVLACVAMEQATALSHKPKRSVPVVLHPKWHAVARSGIEDVVVSGRYVYIGSGSGSGVVIDEQTRRQLAPTPPAGCYFDNANAPALGGSWVVATCNPLPLGPRYLYALYSIPNGTWTPFMPGVKQMFAFNADCKTGDPQCSAAYVAVGNQWIEFQVTCGYHCGPTTYAFQNIQSGQVDDQPPDWKPGGSEIPDLNSTTPIRTLCPPLRVPAGFTAAYTGQTFPGSIKLDGLFAVAQPLDATNFGSRYLERCGSHLHAMIDPRGWPLAANTHAVVWTTNGISSKIDGLLLPTLRRLAFNAPSRYVNDMVLSPRNLYVYSQGRVWRTASPTLPRHRHRHRHRHR